MTFRLIDTYCALIQVSVYCHSFLGRKMRVGFESILVKADSAEFKLGCRFGHVVIGALFYVIYILS